MLGGCPSIINFSSLGSNPLSHSLMPFLAAAAGLAQDGVTPPSSSRGREPGENQIGAEI